MNLVSKRYLHFHKHWPINNIQCLLFYRAKFPNEYIPCLEEVVDLCINLGLQMYIDVKAATQSRRVSYKNRYLLIHKQLTLNSLVLHCTRMFIPVKSSLHRHLLWKGSSLTFGLPYVLIKSRFLNKCGVSLVDSQIRCSKNLYSSYSKLYIYNVTINKLKCKLKCKGFHTIIL